MKEKRKNKNKIITILVLVLAVIMIIPILFLGKTNNNSKLLSEKKALANRISELEQQIRLLQNDIANQNGNENSDYSIEFHWGTFHIGLIDELDNFAYISKERNDIDPNFVEHGSVISSLQMECLKNCDFTSAVLDNNYRISIPEYDVVAGYQTHENFTFANNGLITQINLTCKDNQNNTFDFNSVNRLSKTTYNIFIDDYSYELFSDSEKVGTAYEYQQNVLKTFSLNLTISVENYSAEEIIMPELGKYVNQTDNTYFEFTTQYDELKLRFFDGNTRIRVHSITTGFVDQNTCECGLATEDYSDIYMLTWLSNSSFEYNGITYTLEQTA